MYTKLPHMTSAHEINVLQVNNKLKTLLLYLHIVGFNEVLAL